MVAGGSMIAPVADQASQRPKTVTSQEGFPSRAATGLSAVLAAGLSIQPSRRFRAPNVLSNHHIRRRIGRVCIRGWK
jgi:hypothetical protein